METMKVFNRLSFGWGHLLAVPASSCEVYDTMSQFFSFEMAPFPRFRKGWEGPVGREDRNAREYDDDNKSGHDSQDRPTQNIQRIMHSHINSAVPHQKCDEKTDGGKTWHHRPDDRRRRKGIGRMV